MKTLYMNRDEMYSVEKDESTNDHYLVVVVGGIGMYETKRKLTREQVEEFRQDPTRLMPLVQAARLEP